MKTCSKCSFVGKEYLFVKDENCCKVCRKKYTQIYRQNNKIKIAISSKQRYEVNKIDILIKTKAYYENNKSTILDRNKNYKINNKESNKITNLIYSINNKEHILEYQAIYRANHKCQAAEYKKEYYKKRRKEDPIFKLKSIISNSIYKYLHNHKLSKNNISILNHMPQPIIDIKLYIESLFDPWMTWQNHGKYNAKIWNDNDQTTWTWQLDHIIPHSTFKYDTMDCEEFRKCWALSNLRPYSAKQNILDGGARVRHKKDKQ